MVSISLMENAKLFSRKIVPSYLYESPIPLQFLDLLSFYLYWWDENILILFVLLWFLIKLKYFHLLVICFFLCVCVFLSFANFSIGGVIFFLIILRVNCISRHSNLCFPYLNSKSFFFPACHFSFEYTQWFLFIFRVANLWLGLCL